MQKLITIFSLLGVMLILSTNSIHAQSTTLENVKKIRLRSSGSIINDGVVQGYYFFYKVDRVDRKTNLYSLEILDQNLEQISRKKIEGSRYLTLTEGVYNGSSIMLKFYDLKEKKFEFKQYGQDSELINKRSLDVKRRFAMVQSSNSNDGEIIGKNLYSVPNVGFVHTMMNKNKKIGYQINFYPNGDDGKSWSFNSNAASKQIEVAEFLGADEDIVLLSVQKKKSIFKSKSDIYIVGLDTKTGKKVFEKDFNDENRPVQIMNAFLDSDAGTFNLFGIYFKKGGNPAKDKSMGLFSYSLKKDGKVNNKEHISWAKDVSKVLPVNAKGKIDGAGYIFFHKIVKSADGKILAIGEQYRKAASALGIASRALGGGGSVVKIVVEDFYIFEFNSDFSLNDVHIFEKGNTDVQLPEGSLMYGPQRLATLIDYYEQFDYEYTQRNRDNSVLSVGYIDHERRKGEKNGYVFGSVTYAEGEFSTDKIKLDSKANQLRVYPAKPGYVMITEYFRKLKKIDIRLEKINF